MKQVLVKVQDSDGSVHFERSRHLTLFNQNGKYVFKDYKGEIVEPTEIELKLYNEFQSGGIQISNGWLTFMGIILLIELIFQIVLVGKLT